jgi:hypothetical protein
MNGFGGDPAVATRSRPPRLLLFLLILGISIFLLLAWWLGLWPF